MLAGIDDVIAVVYIETTMNAATETTFALTNVPGCVDGFMPLVDVTTREQAEIVADAYRAIGRDPRVVLVTREQAHEWLLARAGEHSSSSKAGAVRKRAGFATMAASV